MYEDIPLGALNHRRKIVASDGVQFTLSFLHIHKSVSKEVVPRIVIILGR